MEGHNELMHCPACRKNYSIQGNRLPILLKCAHSICDFCLKSEMKLKREVVCRRCNIASKMTKNDQGKDNMDEFPVHYYIAGILVQEKLNMIRVSNNITDLSFKVDLNISAKKKCDKCGTKEAVVQCDQCEDSFCTGCDNVVHNITTGSKKHRRKRISSIPLPIAMLDKNVPRCEQHNLDITYSCSDCKEHVCSECILQSHKDHSYGQLTDKHDSAIDETYDLLDKVQEIVPRFSYSQSKINEICTKMETKAQLCQKTSKPFETMFGNLQLCESENRIKIREFCMDQISNLRKSMDALTKRINDVKEFLRIKSDLNDTSIELFKVNLNEINGALNEIISTPWYMKKEILESIDKHEFEKCNATDFNGLIHLNLDEFPKIELLPTDQVTSDDLDDVDSIISKSDLAVKFRLKNNRADNFDKLSIMGSTLSLASKYSKDDSSEVKDGRKLKAKIMYTPDTGTASRVIISHMTSPASFYVQICKNREVFEFFKRKCEKWATQAPLPTELKIDQIYLTPIFKDTTLKEWKRVQIKKMTDKKTCSVFFVDYGHMGTVSTDNLKVISDRIKPFLPFAFHCRLNSSFPRQNTWSVDDTTEIMEILTKYKWMEIQVRRKLEHIFAVDLYLFPEKPGSRIESLEVLLSGLSKMSRYNCLSEHSEQIVDLTSESEITIISDETITVDKGAKKGDEEEPRKKSNDEIFRIEVTVLRCENPYNIVLSLPNRLLELNELSKKMQEFYAIEANLKPLNEADVKCDTVCLAYSNTCTKWCRAKICELCPQIDKVAVYFFDDGVREDKATNAIYELHKEFLTAFSGVIKGFLAGLHPPCRKDTWPKQTCDRLQQLLSDNKVYMTKMGSTVDKSLPVDFCYEDCIEMDALKPSVFHWKSVREILINEGLACVESQFKSVINQTEDQIMNELTGLNERISDSEDDEGDAALNSVDKNAKWLPSQRITERIFFAKPMSVDMEAFIYLFNVNEGYKSINRIRDVLNTMLINSKPNLNRLWKKGDICSAMFFADNQFYRAEINGIEDGNNYSVEFIDYGNVETCSTAELREEVFLLDIPKQVHKCRVKDLNDLLKPWENDEVFLKQILDYVHAVIVEKQVSAELLEYDSSGCPVLNICVGENLITLVKEELARLKNKDARCFTLLDYDKKALSINVLVTDIISRSEVILLLLKEFEPFQSDFEKMLNHIKFQAKSQEKVTDFQVDKIGIAFDTESSTWQRAKIYTKLNSYTNLVNVYFVDLGIIREINKDLIREIRDDWLKLPVKSYIASLHGLQESVHSSNGQQSDFVHKLKSCITLDKEYYGVITGSADGILKCDIYDMDRRTSVYAHLK